LKSVSLQQTGHNVAQYLFLFHHENRGDRILGINRLLRIDLPNAIGSRGKENAKGRAFTGSTLDVNGRRCSENSGKASIARESTTAMAKRTSSR